MAGQNFFLIVVSVVGFLMCLAVSVYILAHFQHPQDTLQAWFPKGVVVLSLTLTMVAILLLPLDVANRSACDAHLVLSACELTLPMEKLWYAVVLSETLLILFVIPFTMFYYEADSELTTFGKVWSAGQWVLMTFVVASLTVGLAYGFVGYVDYPVQSLRSGLLPLDADFQALTTCIGEGQLCDATAESVTTETWSVRPTLPVYVIALASVLSWVLFMVFAGVGVVAFPVDCIKGYISRPTKTIPKSQYIKMAGELGARAKELVAEAKAVQTQERASGKTRKTRRQVKQLQAQMLELEQDEASLAAAFPQGEDADVTWAATVLMYIGMLMLGVVGIAVSTCWIVHIILYMFIDPPISPLLNNFFMDLDATFGLFGTAAFALFCFYLILCVMKGNFTLGLKLLIFDVHPMRVGATMMSSFLFNVGLIMLCTFAVIQFCAQAFDVYANETAIDHIFGNQIRNLRGLGAVYKENVFLYCFFAFASLSLFVVPFTAFRRPKPKGFTLEV
mmetsp:Transcript_285/g.888  ORF Transcript_285/g.888 Transcript_285/m.888 type:complete len:505 (-) Transcript_285:677-2191(-)